MKNKRTFGVVLAAAIMAIWAASPAALGDEVEEDQVLPFERGIVLYDTSDNPKWEFKSDDDTPDPQRILTLEKEDDNFVLKYQPKGNSGQNAGPPIPVYLEISDDLPDDGDEVSFFYISEDSSKEIKTAVLDEQQLRVSVIKEDGSKAVDVWIPKEYLAMPISPEEPKEETEENGESGEAEAGDKESDPAGQPEQPEQPKDIISFQIPEEDLRTYQAKGKDQSAKIVLDMIYEEREWKIAEDEDGGPLLQVIGSDLSGLKTENLSVLIGFIFLMAAAAVSLGMNVFLIMKRRG